MPPDKKYQDFAESNPVEKAGKKAPWTPDVFIGITCPHCSTMFVELTASSLKSAKASQCLRHLRVCPEYKGSVAPAPEKKEGPSNAELLKKMDQMREETEARSREMREENRSMLRKVAYGLGLGDPVPEAPERLIEQVNSHKDKEMKKEVNRQIKRMQEGEGYRIQKDVHKLQTILKSDEKMAKRFCAAMHPDKTDPANHEALTVIRDRLGL